MLSHTLVWFTPSTASQCITFGLSFFQEKRKLQDETEAMSDRLQEETESRKKMADKLSHERHQNQKEKECTQEVQLASFIFLNNNKSFCMILHD